MTFTHTINQTARDEGLLDTAKDCFRFVTTFFEPIDVSATHIYHSALELSPLSSIVRRLYYHQRHPPFPRVVAGTLGSWPDDINVRSTAESYYGPSVWSPCGRLVATSYQGQGGVEIRDALTSELFSTLLSTNPIRALAYSPDGRALAALSGISLVIWDIQTGGAARKVDCGGTGNAPLVWLLDGRAIGTICTITGVMQVYNIGLGTMQSLGTLWSSGEPCLWAHDKTFRIMTTEWDGQTRTIDIFEVGSVLTKIESFHVGLLGRYDLIETFSPATYRISVKFRGQLYILDIRNSECLLKTGGVFNSQTFSSDGNLFAGFMQSSVWIWRYNSGSYTLWRTLSGQTIYSPDSLQFSPACSPIMGLSSRSLQVWRLDGPPIVAHSKLGVPLGALSDRGNYVATGNRGSTTVTITNLLSPAPPQSINTDIKVSGLALTGNILLVMGYELKMITAWRLTEEGVVEAPPGGRSAGRGGSIWTIQVPLVAEVSIEGRMAVMRSHGNVIYSYDTVTGEQLWPAQAPPDLSLKQYSIYNLAHGLHNLRWLREHNVHPNEGWPVPFTAFEERWVKDPEGRHRLWIHAAWRLPPRSAGWLHNSTTLWLDSQYKLFIVMF